MFSFCYCSSFAKDFRISADVRFLGFCVVSMRWLLVFVNTLVFHEDDGFVTCAVFICRKYGDAFLVGGVAF